MAISPKTPGGSSYGFKFAWEIIPTVDRVKLNNVIKSQEEILASVNKIHEAMKKTGQTTDLVWGLGKFEVYKRIFDYAVTKIAEVNKLYTELYYLDKRIGSSGGLAIAGFQNFAYAAQQIGLTKQAGLNLIESFGAATRTNPGVSAFAQRLAPSSLGQLREPQEAILSIVGNLKKQYGESGYFIAAQLAQNFGIEEDKFRNLYTNYDDIIKAYEEHKQKIREFNLTTNQISKTAVDLSREWHKLTDTISLYETKLSSWISQNVLIPVLKDINTNMNPSGNRLTPPLGKEGALSKYYANGPLDILYNWFYGESKSGAGVPGLRGTISPFSTSTVGPSGNAQQDAIKRLMGMGLPYNSAVGAMIGLTGESGASLNPTAYEPSGGGRGAFGIAQWRGERQRAFEAMFGHSIFNSTAAEQWQFLQWELQGGDTGAASAFKMLQNPNLTSGQATTIWENLFERHGNAAYTSQLAGQANAYAAKNPTVNIDHDQNITVNIQGNADKDTVQRMGTILKPNLDNMSDQMKMSVRGNNFR